MSEPRRKRRLQSLRILLVGLIVLVAIKLRTIITNVQKRWTPNEELQRKAQILQNSTENRNGRNEELIDFAVIGFSKCGTTYLLQNVLNTSQIYWGNKEGGLPREVHDLRKGRIKEFNEKYEGHVNKKTSDGDRVFNAFKSPEVLQSETFLSNIEKHIPSTDLIVSIRHPILHFQSLYNFKFLRHGPTKAPYPNHLIGECDHDCKSDCKVVMKHRVCTGISKFHEGLSRLNFTAMNSPEELDLLHHHKRSIHGNFTGRLFLVELGQLSDRTSRRDSFQKDLEDFLGLESDSIQFPERNTKRDKYLFDICEERFNDVRDELLQIGNNASKWIQEYFIKSPRTVISNRNHFVELIEAWKFDPCEHS